MVSILDEMTIGELEQLSQDLKGTEHHEQYIIICAAIEERNKLVRGEIEEALRESQCNAV